MYFILYFLLYFGKNVVKEYRYFMPFRNGLGYYLHPKHMFQKPLCFADICLKSDFNSRVSGLFLKSDFNYRVVGFAVKTKYV